MNSRQVFSNELAKLELTHIERAVALLWYYRYSQEFIERSAGELAKDLHDDGFPRPNVTILKNELRKNKFTIRGKRKDTYQIDVRRLDELDAKYLSLARIRKHVATNLIIPKELVQNTRQYLESMVNQINSAYELGLFDCCAVMMRRLMESLIIEIYIVEKRKSEIQASGNFFMLEKLINHISSDTQVTLSRNSPKTMKDIKQLGDTAAHDRTYITKEEDINEFKSSYRRLITELLTISKIIT